MEVISPAISSRMENARDLAGLGIDGGKISSFVPVAQHTGKGEIIRLRQAAVFSTENVVDLMGETRIVLANQAVFAAVICATNYFSPEKLADVTGHEKGFGGL